MKVEQDETIGVCGAESLEADSSVKAKTDLQHGHNRKENRRAKRIRLAAPAANDVQDNAKPLGMVISEQSSSVSKQHGLLSILQSGYSCVTNTGNTTSCICFLTAIGFRSTIMDFLWAGTNSPDNALLMFDVSILQTRWIERKSLR